MVVEKVRLRFGSESLVMSAPRPFHTPLCPSQALPQAMTIVRSPLLQGGALEALQAFFAALAASPSPPAPPSCAPQVGGGG